MGLLKRIRNSNLVIRLRSWEYWPMEIVYIPVMLYWIWLSIKARSPFFFAASNPGIEYGGMLGESKIKILEEIDESLKPKTLFFKAGTQPAEVISSIIKEGLSYPLIFKPDIGERGLLVEKIDNDTLAENYVNSIKINFLVQEYVDLPIELGVFYFRYPNRSSGRISSITIKEFLKVTGDGTANLEELILRNPRSKLQHKALKEKYGSTLKEVPPQGEERLLVPLGNHCKGAAFIDGNHRITPGMTRSFDRIASQINGFFIGRFDLKCNSWEDLEKGNVIIMELNGSGAEPGHIYHPGASIREAYKTLFYHMRVLLKISKQNKQLGARYLSWKEGWYVFTQLPTFKKLGIS